jgi:hypothetical protein
LDDPEFVAWLDRFWAALDRFGPLRMAAAIRHYASVRGTDEVIEGQRDAGWPAAMEVRAAFDPIRRDQIDEIERLTRLDPQPEFSEDAIFETLTAIGAGQGCEGGRAMTGLPVYDPFDLLAPLWRTIDEFGPVRTAAVIRIMDGVAVPPPRAGAPCAALDPAHRALLDEVIRLVEQDPPSPEVAAAMVWASRHRGRSAP